MQKKRRQRENFPVGAPAPATLKEEGKEEE